MSENETLSLRITAKYAGTEADRAEKRALLLRWAEASTAALSEYGIEASYAELLFEAPVKVVPSKAQRKPRSDIGKPRKLAAVQVQQEAA